LTELLRPDASVDREMHPFHRATARELPAANCYSSGQRIACPRRGFNWQETCQLASEAVSQQVLVLNSGTRIEGRYDGGNTDNVWFIDEMAIATDSISLRFKL
jgi:hypothetical protein